MYSMGRARIVRRKKWHVLGDEESIDEKNERKNQGEKRAEKRKNRKTETQPFVPAVDIFKML